MTGMVFDVQGSSFVDGPGIRTTVFFKGCNLRCAWCHNPESQSAEKQLLYYKDKCTGCEKCLEKCPNGMRTCDFCGKCEFYCLAEARRVCGKAYTVEELFAQIVADKRFYETSGGGVTFSGGECMLQLDFLCELLKKCKEEGIQTAVDTAGHVPFASFEQIMPLTDLFLYDIKVMDNEKHKTFVGVDNTLILSNLAELLQRGKRVWVRVPVVAGVNDREEDMRAIRAFFEKHGFPEKVELLPYHAMGEGKALALGLKPRRFSAPNEDQMEALRKIFS